MERNNAANTVRTLAIVNLVLGLWLIVSPYLFSYTGGAITNSVLIGIIVAAMAIVRLASPTQTWASWLNGIAGLWLIVAPFIIGFTVAAAYWNEIIIGIAIAVVGFWNASIGLPAHTTTTHRHI